jgi:hypothetical protein
MDGGTICSTEKRFTVRVPELRSSTTLAVARCEKHGKEVLRLDNAFSLIEGHPRRESQNAQPLTRRLRHPSAAPGKSRCRGSRGRVTAGTEIGWWECEIVVGDGMNFGSGAL